MYKDIVLEHFTSPRNVGVLEDADGYAHVDSSVCGDAMELYIKVQDGLIADIKYRTFGCAAAIASSSYTTERVRGQTLEQAASVKEEDISHELGLPDVKMHCSLLAVTALQEAIADYRRKSAQQD